MKLDIFIAKTRGRESDIRNLIPKSAYVKFPGFKSLFVRFGPGFINGRKVNEVFTIANMTATKPGKGALTNLINHMNEKYASVPIVIENVLQPEILESKLMEFGFITFRPNFPPSYFLGR
jgi:hypothetical protein